MPAVDVQLQTAHQ